MAAFASCMLPAMRDWVFECRFSMAARTAPTKARMMDAETHTVFALPLLRPPMDAHVVAPNGTTKKNMLNSTEKYLLPNALSSIERRMGHTSASSVTRLSSIDLSVSGMMRSTCAASRAPISAESALSSALFHVPASTMRSRLTRLVFASALRTGYRTRSPAFEGIRAWSRFSNRNPPRAYRRRSTSGIVSNRS